MNQGLMQFYQPVRRMANGGAITNALLEYIAQQEGFRSSPYKDTYADAIGYGSMVTPEDKERGFITLADGTRINIDKDITEEEGRAMMADRANFNFNVGMNSLIEKGVDVNALPQGVQFALQDLTYQTGGGIFDKAPKLVEALKANDVEKISEELKTTGRTVGGEVVESLIPRAERRADMALGKNIVRNPLDTLIAGDRYEAPKLDTLQAGDRYVAPKPDISPQEKSYRDMIKQFGTTLFRETFGSKPLGAATLNDQPSGQAVGMSGEASPEQLDKLLDEVDKLEPKEFQESFSVSPAQQEFVPTKTEFPLREQAKAILESDKSGVLEMPKSEPKEDKDFTALQSFAKKQGIDLPNQDHLVRGIRVGELRDPDRGSGLMEGEARDAKTRATIYSIGKRNNAARTLNDEIKILQEQMNIADQVKKKAKTITFLDGTQVNQADIESMGGYSEESLKERREKIEALSQDYKETLAVEERVRKIKYPDSTLPFGNVKFDPNREAENEIITENIQEEYNTVFTDDGKINKEETEQRKAAQEAQNYINEMNKKSQQNLSKAEGKNIIDEAMKRFGITSPLAQFKFFTTLAASPTVVGGIKAAADESIKVQQNQDLIRVKEIIAKYQSSGRPMTDGQMWSAFMDGPGKNFKDKTAFDIYVAQLSKEEQDKYKKLGMKDAMIEEFKIFKDQVAQIYGMGSMPSGMNPISNPIYTVDAFGALIK